MSRIDVRSVLGLPWTPGMSIADPQEAVGHRIVPQLVVRKKFKGGM